jgi:hypothetical protein
MPCYEPPPPWEGKQQNNAQQATQLLCKLVSERVRAKDKTIQKELLLWFIEHRNIDIQIAASGYYRNPSHEEAEISIQDILIASQLIDWKADIEKGY